ncbi:MAG: D-alanyl-D-alanine carboxypeptidase, partial [uncultured Gemmatimonadaceae bacterium]
VRDTGDAPRPGGAGCRGAGARHRAHTGASIVPPTRRGLPLAACGGGGRRRTAHRRLPPPLARRRARRLAPRHPPHRRGDRLGGVRRQRRSHRRLDL